MSFISRKIREFPRDPDVRCVNCGAVDCVWAHLPYHDAGMGQKCDDYFGAPLCHTCHDFVDGRGKMDGLGHEGPPDFEWRYRVLRRAWKALIAGGIVTVR